MCSTFSYLMVVFTAGSIHWIHDGKVEIPSTMPAPVLFTFQKQQLSVTVCNVSARLGEVRVFANLHYVCRGAARDSEPEDCSLYCSSHDGGPRKELLGDVIYTFVLLFY